MEAPTKYELFHLLLNFSDKWYDIGLSLQVRRNVLDNIKPRLWYNNDKLRAVIDKFSTTELSPVTWETVISAMESPTIDNKAIANKIRQYLSTGKSKLFLSSNEVINYCSFQTTTVKCIQFNVNQHCSHTMYTS